MRGWAPYWRVSKMEYSQTLGFVLSDPEAPPFRFVVAIFGEATFWLTLSVFLPFLFPVLSALEINPRRKAWYVPFLLSFFHSFFLSLCLSFTTAFTSSHRRFIFIFSLSWMLLTCSTVLIFVPNNSNCFLKICYLKIYLNNNFIIFKKLFVILTY
jgi:hypothetical protein